MRLSPMFRAAIVLGLLASVGPIAIDMFLPALPAISADLGATVAATQGTFTFYLIAFGLAQMVYGPWSDQAGRRLPIFVGLTVFGLGSIAATLAQNIETLIAARVVQGLGGAALMVVTRAIIRDQFTGYDATRLMGFVMLVFSVSPLFAPIAGAGLILATGWRAIFACMAIVAALAFLLTFFFQPETLHKDHRRPVNLRSMATGIRRLASDPLFLCLTFIGGLGLASFFVFISSGAFIYEASYGLTPTQFSLAFSVNAFGFISASQAAAPLMRRHGAIPLIRFGVTGYTIAIGILLTLAILDMTPLPVMIAGLIVAFAFMGLVIPTAMVAALDPHGEIAGLASSLGGTLQMIAGGVMVALSGPFFDGTPMPMIAAMAFCAIVALLLSRWVERQHRKMAAL